MTTESRLLVRQLRSVAGRPWQQRLVLKGLGLRGPGSEVVVQNERAMRGMIRKVIHLVSVEEVADAKGGSGSGARASGAAAPRKATASSSKKVKS